MLNINEIYTAISGESRFCGYPCVLVRLTGCHLRCAWCDTEHAFHDGQSISVDDVRDQVLQYQLPTVLVTGGEPLLQRPVLPLMQALLDVGQRVLLETSGTILPGKAAQLAEVPTGVHRIVDIKAPGSGIVDQKIDWQGIDLLTSDDEIKIVCADHNDYQWARQLVLDGRLPDDVTVRLSPVQGDLQPRDLAEWILTDRLDVVFQLQLHKVVWPEAERGV